MYLMILRLTKELGILMSSDNMNCNMNAIHDFIEGISTLRCKYSDAELSVFIDQILDRYRENKYPIDEYQLKKIRKKFNL